MNLEIFEIIPYAKGACMLFLAILFLQSGLDKILDYKGNRKWLDSHFGNSVLRNSVSLLLPIITILELGAGIFSGLGIIQFIVNGSTFMGLIGIQLSGISILALFFGQRVAKDYGGAATLVPYFLVCIFSLFLFSL